METYAISYWRNFSKKLEEHISPFLKREVLGVG